MSFSVEYANQVLIDTFPNSGYIALFSGKPTESSSGTELAVADGYIRESGIVEANPTWSVPSGGQMTNVQAIQFTSTDDWLGVTAIGHFDQRSMGIRTFQQDLPETIQISSGETFSFAAGDIVFTVRSCGV